MGPCCCLPGREVYIRYLCIQKAMHSHLHILCTQSHKHTQSNSPSGPSVLGKPPRSHQSVIMKFSFISVPLPMPCLTTCRKVQIITHTHKYDHSQSCHCLHTLWLASCRAQDEKGLQFTVCCPWGHTAYTTHSNVLSQQGLLFFFTPIVFRNF